MFELLGHIRPVGVFGLLVATVLALRAGADLPTMLWLRPRVAWPVVSGVVLVFWAGLALIFWLISDQALFWLALLGALALGLPVSRELADLFAFRRDDPLTVAPKAIAAAATARQALALDTATDADEAAWKEADAKAEAARLLAELTGVGPLAYRGHIYRKGAVEARMDFVAADDPTPPWNARWRSSGRFPKAAPPAPGV